MLKGILQVVLSNCPSTQPDEAWIFFVTFLPIILKASKRLHDRKSKNIDSEIRRFGLDINSTTYCCMSLDNEFSIYALAS